MKKRFLPFFKRSVFIIISLVLMHEMSFVQAQSTKEVAVTDFEIWYRTSLANGDSLETWGDKYFSGKSIYSDIACFSWEPPYTCSLILDDDSGDFCSLDCMFTETACVYTGDKACEWAEEPDYQVGDVLFEIASVYNYVEITPEKNLGKQNNDIVCQIGNPINPRTGNKLQIEQDYIGAGVFPLVFERVYNSLTSSSGVLGMKWSHYYERSIDTSLSSQVYLRHFDGKVTSFQKYGSGSSEQWIPDDDIQASLKRSSDQQTWIYTSKNLIVERYDTEGKLLSISNQLGFTQTLVYNDDNQLIEVQDPAGRRLTFTYDSSDRLSLVNDPAGYLYEYQYDLNNNLVSVQYPSDTEIKPVRTYHYENTSFPNHLTGITDENENRFASWNYDLEGRAILSEHAGNVEQIHLSYENGKTGVTEESGNVYTVFHTEAQGVLKSRKIQGDPSCGGYVSEVNYDNNGLITSQTDNNGNITRYTYNTSGQETSRIEAADSEAERNFQTAWHAEFNLPIEITEAQKQTNLTYDSENRITIVEETDTQSLITRTTTYSYNTEGLLSTIDGPRVDASDNVFFSYDNYNLVAIGNALGHTTQFGNYDAHGNPQEITFANGLQNILSYDVRGRLTSVISGGEATSYEYDSTGLLTKIIFPNNYSLNYGYDAAQRLTEIYDSAGNHLLLTLNSFGKITQREIKDDQGTLLRYQAMGYDKLNRLISATGGASQTFQFGYDLNGNLIQVDNPLGHTILREFDALDRLVKVTDTMEGVARYVYNDQNLLSEVIDPLGHSTTYQYDGFGNLIQINSPDTGITRITYDLAGNRLTKTDAKNQQTSYTYDALNRLSQITYGDGSSEQFIYYTNGPGLGLLKQVLDSSGITSFEYDLHKRVTKKEQSVAGYYQSVLFAYNSQGELTQMTYPSGIMLQFFYQNGIKQGLAIDGETLVSNISYQAFNVVQSWTWGNGTSYNRTYDQDGGMQSHSFGTFDRYLSYDEMKNITLIESGNPAEESLQYNYDELNRLTQMNQGIESESYTYDAIGNRTSKNAQNYTYHYDSESNRLLDVSGDQTMVFQYDANGNIIHDGFHDYQYDARNRLIGVDSSVDYWINGYGQRVAKGTNDTAERFFVYDLQGRIIGEYNTQNQVIQETVYLDHIPIATIQNGDVYFIHSDHLNTPRKILNSSNSVVWEWNDPSFGHTLPNEDPDEDGILFHYNLRFAGQYYDQETGLHYNYYRDYNPNLGRYIQSDPIGQSGGLNTYVYVEGNPIRWVDPNGLIIGQILVGAAIGASIDGFVEGMDQLANGEEINWIQVRDAAIQGAITGAIAGATGAFFGVIAKAYSPGWKLTAKLSGSAAGGIVAVMTNSTQEVIKGDMPPTHFGGRILAGGIMGLGIGSINSLIPKRYAAGPLLISTGINLIVKLNEKCK